MAGLWYNRSMKDEEKDMTITIYDEKGLIINHLKCNRAVLMSNGDLKVYYDWDGISFALETYEKGKFSWFELEDK